jgi:hypothetical protein
LIIPGLSSGSYLQHDLVFMTQRKLVVRAARAVETARPMKLLYSSSPGTPEDAAALGSRVHVTRTRALTGKDAMALRGGSPVLRLQTDPLVAAEVQIRSFEGMAIGVVRRQENFSSDLLA